MQMQKHDTGLPEGVPSELAHVAVQSGVDAAYWFVEDGSLVYVNDQACLSAELPAAELLALRVQDLFSDLAEMSEDGSWGFWGRVRDEGIVNLESNQQRSDGTVFPVEIRACHVSAEDREYCCASVRDITSRKNLESESEVMQLQLIQADRMACIGALVAGAARQVGNPNSLVKASLSALEEILAGADSDHDHQTSPNSQCQDDISTLLADANQATDRIAAIAGELRDFSQNGNAQTDCEVDVNAAIKAAATLLSPLINRSTRNFSMDLSEGLPMVSGSFQQLEQVIADLMINSCQALPELRCAITVETRLDSESGRILICVHDEGEGIPGSDLEQICDPFFTTKRRQGGTGIGLSVSARIVADHGGTLTFESAEGQGTTATVSLPTD